MQDQNVLVLGLRCVRPRHGALVRRRGRACDRGRHARGAAACCRRCASCRSAGAVRERRVHARLAEGKQLVLRSPGLTPCANGARRSRGARAGHAGQAASWRCLPTGTAAPPAASPGPGRGLPPGRAGRDRHQRQDHRDLADGPAGRAQRQDRGRGRQHRPQPAVDTLAQKREAGALPQVWVLELSSFQLEGVQGFEPTAATVLNITQDHLDWHGTWRRMPRPRPGLRQPAKMMLNRDDAR
jgi:hypothetical protein